VTDNVNFLIADNDANKLQCRLVDQNNVLWTCHKACKIDYMDCRFAICSICYASKSKEMENKQVRAGTNVRKRRRGGNVNKDDDTTACNHNINALVPFMDKSFFTVKYKQTIDQESYPLPVVCSNCNIELVDKLPNDTVNDMKGIMVAV